MRRWLTLIWMVSLAATLVACDDDPDTGPGDGSVDGDGGTGMTLAGLSGDVEVIQDDRGMWHIYAENDLDAVRVEGYLMARDRLMEMQLVRRQARGELSEVFGETTLQDDIGARFEGHARLAEQIWAILSPEEQALLTAFSEGITARMEEIRANPSLRPPGSTIIPVESMRDWEPTDSLSIVRLMTADLSYDIRYDMNRTIQLEDHQAAFPADACTQGLDVCDERQARAGAFHDLYTFAPAEEASIIDGFPNTAGGTTTGITALRPPSSGGAPTPTSERPRPERDVLEAAVAWGEAQELRHQRLFGDALTRGSNSWIVSGDHTADGNPIMNNDPHLSLDSPPLFWMVHLDTKRLGGGDLNVQGLQIVGLPGVLLGYNENISWGMTTHGYDVTDNWLEELNADCTAVLWDDPDTAEGVIEVPLQTISEEIQVATGSMTVEFMATPHHGLIVPGTFDCAAKQAISVRWTGQEPTNELRALLGLMKAGTIEEAEAAWDHFDVGGQTIVVAASDGRIYYTSDMNLPVRPASVMTYDPATQTGLSPCFLMPGKDGTAEWQGYLDDQFVPHALDPAKGYVATANGDPTGVTFDGDPHNDDHFVGCDFDEGFRTARISERLEALITRGNITPDDMKALQADVQSALGRRMTPVLLTELARAEEEMNTPGTHADLTDAVTAAGADMTTILAMRDRLADWGPMYDYDTPAGVADSGSAEPVDASIATSIFNVAFSYLMRNTFYDEFDAMDGVMDGNQIHRTGDVLRTMRWDADDTLRTKHIRAIDPETGLMVYWDDLDTDNVEETRGDRIVRAFASAVSQLETLFGTADMNEWRWGKLHTIRLDSLVPFAENILSIPPEDSTEFPNGFPRHGDREAVDASNFGTFNVDDFDYGSGPQQRAVIPMTPTGPTPFNAIPGGESMDPSSPHFGDEMELWRKNEAPPMYFDFADVEAHEESRMVFTP